jgi:hypothetical protein
MIKRSDRDGHIIYLKTCKYCKTDFWAKKVNGEYCSNACRNLKLKDEKKNRGAKNN